MPSFIRGLHAVFVDSPFEAVRRSVGSRGPLRRIAGSVRVLFKLWGRNAFALGLTPIG